MSWWSGTLQATGESSARHPPRPGVLAGQQGQQGQQGGILAPPPTGSSAEQLGSQPDGRPLLCIWEEKPLLSLRGWIRHSRVWGVAGPQPPRLCWAQGLTFAEQRGCGRVCQEADCVLQGQPRLLPQAGNLTSGLTRCRAQRTPKHG